MMHATKEMREREPLLAISEQAEIDFPNKTRVTFCGAAPKAPS